MKHTRNLAVTIFSLSLLFGGFSVAYASSLYMEPATGVYARGDTFSVKVRLDPQDECINAVDIRIGYPEQSIQAVEIGRGESILPLWIEDPVIDQEKGTIRLVGGIPGGFCGRIPGDPGLTNVIAEIIFQVPGFTIGSPGPNEGAIAFLDGTEVLLNDGFGTPAPVIASDAYFEVGGNRTGENVWFEALRNDDIPPEPFTIQIVQNPSVFEGRHYIAFSTVDKQSGIDHYEVFETDITNEGFTRGSGDESAWVRAESPHVLDDQKLNSVIRVRAIDKAGNQRLSAIIPDESLRKSDFRSVLGPRAFSTPLLYGLGLIIFIIAVLGFILVLRRKRLRGRAKMDAPIALEQDDTSN